MRIIFIHHSTGGNLIKEGKVRSLLYSKNPNIEFWDHSYNRIWYLPDFLASLTHHTGLSDKNGKMTGKDFDIHLSNNSPKEYVEIFSRDESDLTLKSILEFDVIMFKNCFPTTKIESEDQLELYQDYYKKIRSSIDRFKNKTFVLFTPPPLRRELTTEDNAKRAIKLSKFLSDKSFVENHSNLYVFDFFKALSDESGFLKEEHCRFLSFDSHPNKIANQEVTLGLVDFICELIKQSKL